ncbi:MAG: hypothetical protein VSS75_014290 [Candidatus Parabeggiatoa sp.]|nr:hypothetical protein [Candidatus Parabeggiatoa sp.]
MTLEGDSSRDRKHCNNAEAAIEYINKHPHENFVIYDATKDVINEIKRKVNNTIREG